MKMDEKEEDVPLSIIDKIRFTCRSPFTIFLAISIFLTFLVIMNGFQIHADAALEFRNARNLVLYGVIEPAPLLPILLYALLFQIFGINLAIIHFSQAIFTIGVMGIIYKFAEQAGDSRYHLLLAMLTIFLLAPIAFFGIISGKQYPMFMFFALISYYLLLTMTESNNNRSILLAALFMALAYLTHVLATFLAIVPLILFLFMAFKIEKIKALKDFLLFYVTFVTTLFPYLLWRYLIDGLSFYTYPSNWYTQRYGGILNQVYWGIPVPFSFEYYLRWLTIISGTLTPIGIVALFVGLFELRKRNVLYLIMGWIIACLIPFILSILPTYEHYLFMLFPVMAILLVRGTILVQKYAQRNRILILAVIILVILAFSFGTFRLFNASFALGQGRTNLEAEALQHAQWIEPEDVVLARTYILNAYIPYSHFITFGFDLTEEETLTFLNWTSELLVLDILGTHNVSFIVIYTNYEREIAIHSWFTSSFGYPPRHVLGLNSSSFILVSVGSTYSLYQVIEQ